VLDRSYKIRNTFAMPTSKKFARNDESEVTFFRSTADFRNWLEKNYAKAKQLWVGFHRKDSGRPSITWPESVDEALCFGWIDGLRKRIDAQSYKIRFTPRRAISYWSTINIGRVEELTRAGRMRPAGIKAFAQRTPERSGNYSYENRKSTKLDRRAEKQIRASPAAWKFFQAQTPSYRQVITWWVMSAKKDETRARRVAKLIGHSAGGKRL
jgi:uncharacterized protein YdeI (YjbR/CyaY-like superfamily)